MMVELMELKKLASGLVDALLDNCMGDLPTSAELALQWQGCMHACFPDALDDDRMSSVT